METPTTYVIRVWLPDRPGALGAVASRIGALRGDVLGLEIVERGGGQAIDELVVSLPSNVSVDLIVKEISAEYGTGIEDIRPLAGSAYDPQLDLLEAASTVLGTETRGDLADALAEHACRAVQSTWACVQGRRGTAIGEWGDRPNDRWIQSFISGSPATDEADPSPSGLAPVDTIWIPMPAANAAFVIGRKQAFRAKERRRLAALTGVADAWFRRLDQRCGGTRGLIGRPVAAGSLTGVTQQPPDGGFDRS